MGRDGEGLEGQLHILGPAIRFVSDVVSLAVCRCPRRANWLHGTSPSRGTVLNLSTLFFFFSLFIFSFVFFFYLFPFFRRIF